MPWIFARCGITVGLLAVLAWQLGLHSIIVRFHTLALEPLIIVALMLVVQLLLSAWRWKVLVDYFAPIRVSTADLCRFLGASHFYGEVMPSTIGGDVVRTAMLARLTGFGPATLSVILDRITGLAMLLCLMLVLLPLLWWRIGQGSAVFGLALISIAGVAALGALLLFSGQTMPSWLPSAAAPLPKIAAGLRQALFNPILRGRVVGYGLLVQLLSVAVFFVLGRALGSLFSFLDCLLLVPPALLLSALPVSLSGWGVREGALAGAFGLIGAPTAEVVAVSILYGLTSPAIGMVYAVVSLLRRY
jgi:glycosyltransferase 2 family protein